jgi:hypothetical protein
MTGQIELIEAEKDLASKIVFDHDGYVRLEYKEATENGELAAALMRSLMAREAIPPTRIGYFTDPDYNPSKSKSSRADLFLQNAGTLEEMFQHGHFLPYLYYFIYGADLPATIRDVFFAKAQDIFVEANQLIQLARSQARELRRGHFPRDYRLPDLFYQLALDCGCEEWNARSVREAVMEVVREK